MPRTERFARLAATDDHGRPIVATPAQRLALRVLQIACVMVVLAAATYKSFELDRFFVPKELVLHLAALLAGVLCLGAARRAQISRLDLLLGGFLVLSGASAALAQNPWNGVRALGVSASGIVVFWSARALGRAGLARPLVWAIGIAVALGAGVSLAQAYGVRTDFFSLNRAPGGTLGNRNFVAHLCAFGLPVLFLCALRAHRFLGTLLGAVGVAAVACALVLTRSRAAWLGVGAVLAVFLIGWLLVGPARRSMRHWTRLMILLLSAAGGGIAAVTLPNTLHWNSDNPYAETAAGLVNAKEGSGAGRLKQWKNSGEMLMHHPLLGVGPGNWSVRYPEYAPRSDPSMNDNEAGTTSNPWPSSDWVAFASERGVAAVVLLILAFVGLGVAALHRMRAARDADEGLAALALAATLAGTVVVGAFDAVLMLALPSLLVWAALGVLSADEPGTWDKAFPVPLRALGMLLLIGVAGAFTVKSVAQVMAMYVYDGADTVADLQQAARLDPGSYRIQLKLARSARKCTIRKAAADAAHELYPEAGAPKALRSRCGGSTRRRRRG
ncbi:MAG TPA: O-antigen ligase family protein [Longimicrobium sp.]|nr:O-antigen ligase family protein [Longimicrobium sp.]